MFLYEWIETLKEDEKRRVIDSLIHKRAMNLYDTEEIAFDEPSMFNDTNLFETASRPVRHNTDLDSIYRDLHEVGYCRLSGLSCTEYKTDRNIIYEQMVADFADVMDVSATRIKPIKPQKLIDITESSGIIRYYYKMFHSYAMWMVRGHPALVETICDIYNCPPENLCVSYDTMGIRYAPEYLEYCQKNAKPGNRYAYRDFLTTDDLIPHVDQRFEYEFHENYQGIYAFTSTPNQEDGGILLYPSTHHLHGKCLKAIFETPDDQDFLAYPSIFFDMFPDSKPVHIPLKEGEYLIWDSRLVHANCSIDPERNATERMDWGNRQPTMMDWWKMNRIVGYICYHPDNEYTKDTTTVDNIKNLLAEAYNYGYATNHMCNRPRIVEMMANTPDEWLSMYHPILVSRKQEK